MGARERTCFVWPQRLLGKICSHLTYSKSYPQLSPSPRPPPTPTSYISPHTQYSRLLHRGRSRWSYCPPDRNRARTKHSRQPRHAVKRLCRCQRGSCRRDTRYKAQPRLSRSGTCRPRGGHGLKRLAHVVASPGEDAHSPDRPCSHSLRRVEMHLWPRRPGKNQQGYGEVVRSVVRIRQALAWAVSVDWRSPPPPSPLLPLDLPAIALP